MPTDPVVYEILEEHARIEVVLAEDRAVVKNAIRQAAELFSPVDDLAGFVEVLLEALRQPEAHVSGFSMQERCGFIGTPKEAKDQHGLPAH